MSTRAHAATSVSVVVPVLNAEERIARQIEALLPQLDTDTELLLVDNGSTDATPEVIASYVATHQRVRSVHAPEGGVNRARNAGVEAAHGHLILLCDADDEVQPGWVESLREGLRHADLVGGRVIAVDHLTGHVEVVDVTAACMWELGSPWGCCCGFRREVWEQVGGFDPRMSGAFDETDFFLRAQLAGATLAWTPASVRYNADRSPRKARLWDRQRDRYRCRAYWSGRMRGFARSNRLERDLISLVLRLPAVGFSQRLRWLWWTAAVRRWDRFAGFCGFGAREIWRAMRAEDSLGSQHHQSDVVEPGRIGHPIEQ